MSYIQFKLQIYCVADFQWKQTRYEKFYRSSQFYPIFHPCSPFMFHFCPHFKSCTAWNAVISPNLLASRFCGKTFTISPKLCRNYAFPQDFDNRKLREIAAFYAVLEIGLNRSNKESTNSNSFRFNPYLFNNSFFSSASHFIRFTFLCLRYMVIAF